MPLTREHKDRTRAKIIETARVLFNRHGYNKVSIDMIMASASLTRGGFYNHFKNKDELFSEAIRSFLHGRGAEWRNDAGIDLRNLKPETARQMIDSYLSVEHLGDLDGQCPMIALPSDVARAAPEIQQAYHELLEAMIWLFESSLIQSGEKDRSQALSLSAMCVGAMVLAKTLPESTLADEIRAAALASADQLINASAQHQNSF